jgi:hypothetical protein
MKSVSHAARLPEPEKLPEGEESSRTRRNVTSKKLRLLVATESASQTLRARKGGAGRRVVRHGAQAVPAWQAERQLRGLQPLPAWQAEEELRGLHRLPAWQAEAPLRGLQPLPAWQAETQLRGLQPMPARQAETQLRGMQWV